MDQRFAKLMEALRKLALLEDDKSVETAKLQIWNYFQPLISLETLRAQAIAEENKAPSDLGKLFWRDVAAYCLYPTKPKIG